MDHHLVALARGAGIDAVVERRLGEHRERVGLLLRHRRGVSVRRLLAPPLVEGLARRLQRLQEQGAHLRGQSPADPHRTVFVVIHMQRTTRVLPSGFLSLGLAIHSPPATDDPLDVLGGAGAAHRQQALLGFRGRHAGQLADLGIGQFAAGERLRQPRQRAEGAGHPDVLPGRARRESHAPRQPAGAGAEAVAPAAAGVELADEIEEPGGGRIKMRRQHGDLVTEPLEVGLRFGRGDVHGEPPSAGATLHPRFGRTWEAHWAAIAARSRFSRETDTRSNLGASLGRWRAVCHVRPARGDRTPRKLSSKNRRRVS